MTGPRIPLDIGDVVRQALDEDMGTGDLSAAIVPANAVSRAKVLSREDAILCGAPWFTEAFRQLHEGVRVSWLLQDGAAIRPGQAVCELDGPTRALLSGERTALNFLQLLSGTATLTRAYAALLEHTETQLLDTRKTLPGLRSAQKYAVLCGGGKNHRKGLYDAALLKENHIRAVGSLAAALEWARSLSLQAMVEVENEAELEEALRAGADAVLLDNFTVEQAARAVQLSRGRARLEASGGIDLDDVPALAAAGVDCISVGGLTKNVRAIDFSMLLETE